MNKVDAYIVDPEIDTRMRLKQVTASVVEFGKVHQLTDLRSAMSKLEKEGGCDVMFLSHGFSKDEVTAFIRKAKESPKGQDTAFVLLVSANNQESANVAANVLVGADGLLFEPYSVDQCVEITRLAGKVKKERSGAREQAAMTFLLNDVMSTLDSIAYLKSAGYDVGRGFKKFKQMCKVFQNMQGESKQAYYKMAVERFIDAPLPTKMFQQKKYSGASSRVKKKMEEKLLEELEKGLEDDSTATA